MNRTLKEVITDILTHNGAIVEDSGDGLLDVLAPSNLSSVLSIPEFSRLCFSYNEACGEAIYASYDSDFLASLGRVLGGKGRFSIARYETYCPNTERLSEVISKKLVFGNATFRLDSSEVKDISYLLCYFKYVALSDERQEGVLPFLINELNLSTVPIEPVVTGLKEVVEVKDIERHDKAKVLQSAYTGASHLVEEKLGEFIKSLERRLNRDIKRVYEYYETLKEETKRAIKRKAPTRELDSNNESLERQKERTIKGDGVDKLLSKLDVIEVEQRWKAQDLVSKYAMTIQIEPFTVISIETQSPALWIDIKRRLSSRRFPVTFNPIIRQLDALPCEACFNPRGPYYVCDDKLHIVCARCFKRCPDCGKQFCSACHRDRCPKCNRAIKKAFHEFL